MQKAGVSHTSEPGSASVRVSTIEGIRARASKRDTTEDEKEEHEKDVTCAVMIPVSAREILVAHWSKPNAALALVLKEISRESSCRRDNG